MKINWDDENPNLWKSKSHVPVTTNQISISIYPNKSPFSYGFLRFPMDYETNQHRLTLLLSFLLSLFFLSSIITIGYYWYSITIHVTNYQRIPVTGATDRTSLLRWASPRYRTPASSASFTAWKEITGGHHFCGQEIYQKWMTLHHFTSFYIIFTSFYIQFLLFCMDIWM